MTRLMLLLSQNSDGVLQEAWAVVFLMAALATVISLGLFLGTHKRRTGFAVIGYSIMTIGTALVVFLDLRVLGTILALIGGVLAMFWYCTTLTRPIDPWSRGTSRAGALDSTSAQRSYLESQ